MGLFSKKGPCVICGGKVSGLFPWKVDGQYVCDNCHGIVDLPGGMEGTFSLDDFQGYMAFRRQNQQLKSQFTVSQTIDFGLLDTKILFDCQNRLFCFDKHLDKTIFQGGELVSFVIKEDSSPLYEGSAQGLVRHDSPVFQKVQAMAPRIAQYKMEREMREVIERLKEDDGGPKPTRRYIDVPEPFRAFNVEFHFRHPYWSVLRCDMSGPTFDSERPDADDYLDEYRRDVAMLEQLAETAMCVAFPNAPERETQNQAQTAQPSQPAADPVVEIKRYMALMEQGIITPGEFEAKKKQLLGL